MDKLLGTVMSGIGKKRKKGQKKMLINMWEDWTDSDSDDSDFELSDEEPKKKKPKQSPQKKNKLPLQKQTKPKAKFKNRRRLRTFSSDSDYEGKAEKNVDFLGLPNEIWLKILSIAVADGSLPSFFKLKHVCPRLNQIILAQKQLWHKLDLSSGKVTQKGELLTFLLSSELIGSQTITLNFSHWKKNLKDDLLLNILRQTPKLRNLNVAFCQNLAIPSILEKGALSSLCPQLTSLDLSFCKVKDNNKVGASLFNFLREPGSSNLQSLYLNGNWVFNLQDMLRKVSSWSCAGVLRILDMSGVEVRRAIPNIEIWALAQGTPELRQLHLRHTPINFSWDQNPGTVDHGLWREMTDLDVSRNPSDPTGALVTLEDILSFLSYCPKLAKLSLNGHKEVLSQLGEFQCGLRQLQLNHSSLGSLNQNTIFAMGLGLEKVMETVEELDLSWVSSREEVFSVVGVMAQFGINHGPLQVRKLNLTGSSVQLENLKSLLGVCPGLEWLDLSSCRQLPLGVKRVHRSQAEILSLRADKL